MKRFISNLIFLALDSKIDKSLIDKTTMESRLKEFDFASSILIVNKNIDKDKFITNLKEYDLFEKVEIINNFVNISLNKIYFLNNSFEVVKEDKKIMIEFSSPNSNKPLHLGHIRNTLLGNSLSNLLAKKYNIIKANLVNDRGIHICKSMIGYLKLSQFKTPEEAKMKSDFFVGYCYVLFAQKEKDDPSLIKDAEDMLKKWESGDKEILNLWHKLRNWSLEGMKETYSKLGVNFDVWFYESDIYNKGKEIILDAYKNGKVKLEDLGYVVRFGDKAEGYKVVLRKDETSIYITQDIYLAKLKFDEYNLDKSIYVVGSEQKDYFSKLKKVLIELGYERYSNDLEHYCYGMIYLPDGKMKSREGNVVDADNLIDDLRTKAKTILLEKNKDSNLSIEDESKIIADAALKYFILKYDSKKDFTFDVHSSLSFEGNSGPYLLYTYARINSLLNNIKSYLESAKQRDPNLFDKKNNIKSDDLFVLNEFEEFVINPNSVIKYIPSDLEKELSAIMIKYNDKLDEAIEKKEVHLILTYITDLANNFNSLYANLKIIDESNNNLLNDLEVRYPFYNKLKLIFEDIFNILGITKLDKM